MKLNILEIALVSSIGIDHVSYILVLYSLASIMFLCMYPPPLKINMTNWLPQS